MQDIIKELFREYHYERDLKQFNSSIKKFWTFTNELKLDEIKNIDNWVLNHDEFVPGTSVLIKTHWIIKNPARIYDRITLDFGQPL